MADEADIAAKKERVQLDDVVTQAILQRSALARQSNIDLGALGVDVSCGVCANKALTEGMLNNLLDNAMRYGKPVDGRVQEVTIALNQTAEGIDMVVQDNGPGIAPEEYENIVKRGVQGANSSGSNQGVGLGLSIVTRYAELSGAKFWLQKAAQGQGLEAHVLFVSAQYKAGESNRSPTENHR